MKYQEIESIFTAEVSRYIAEGWRICTVIREGFGIHEIAKIYLTNGEGCGMRILLTEEYGFSGATHICLSWDGFALPEKIGRTWRPEFQGLNAVTFFRHCDSDWFLEDEFEVERMKEVHRRRARSRRFDDFVCLPEKFNRIALKWVRKNVKGCKTIKADKIQGVEKWIDGTVNYRVHVLGKGSFRMGRIA